jgi:hypothetical protein
MKEQPIGWRGALTRQRCCMEQELHSSKRAARPSHGAVEDKIGTSKLTRKTEQEKVDQVAMKGAKRAQNRILNDEEKLPGSTIFTK